MIAAIRRVAREVDGGAVVVKQRDTTTGTVLQGKLVQPVPYTVTDGSDMGQQHGGSSDRDDRANASLDQQRQKDARRQKKNIES